MPSAPFSVPGLGPAGNMAVGLAAPMLDQYARSQGMTPGTAGAANPYAGAMSRELAAQFQRQHEFAAQHESNIMAHTLKMGAQMMGLPEAQALQFGKMGGGAYGNFVAPFLAAANPQLADQLGGFLGSPTVLGSQLGMAGRFLGDPFSGGRMFDPSGMAAVGQNIFGEHYAGRSRSSLGISAGQFGSLANELAQRGMLKAGSPEALQQQVMEQLKQDPARMAQYQAEMQPGMAPHEAPTFRGIAGAKVGEDLVKQVKPHIDSMKAMRELFASIGHGDASISELFQTMEKITQNANQMMSPEQTAMKIRQFEAALRNGSMNLNHLLSLQQVAGGYAQQMGVHPTSVPDVSYGALTFSSAFRKNGGAAGGFGAATDDQAAMMDVQLRTGAAGSRANTVVGNLLRFADIGKAPAGSELAVATEAIKLGKDTYEYGGQTRMVPGLDQDRARAVRMVQQAVGGEFSESTIRQGLIDQGAGLRYSQRFNTGEIVRDLQGTDVTRRLAVPAAAVLSDAAGTEISTADSQRLVQTALSQPAGSSFEEIQKAMIAESRRIQGSALATMSEPKLKNAIDRIESTTRGRHFRMGTAEGGLVQINQMHGSHLRRERRKEVEANRMQAELSQSLSDVTTPEALRNVVGALQEGQSFSAALLQGMGYSPTAAIEPPVQNQLKKMDELQSEIADKEKEKEGATPERRRQLNKEIEELKIKQRQMRDSLAPLLRQANMSPAALTPAKAERFAGAATAGKDIVDPNSGEKGAEFRRGVGERMQATGGLGVALNAGSTDALGRYKNTADRKAIAGAVSADRELRSLAAKYAGGDVASLLHMAKQDKLPEDVKKAVLDNWQSSQQGLQALKGDRKDAKDVTDEEKAESRKLIEEAGAGGLEDREKAMLAELRRSGQAETADKYEKATPAEKADIRGMLGDEGVGGDMSAASALKTKYRALAGGKGISGDDLDKRIAGFDALDAEGRKKLAEELGVEQSDLTSDFTMLSRFKNVGGAKSVDQLRERLKETKMKPGDSTGGGKGGGGSSNITIQSGTVDIRINGTSAGPGTVAVHGDGTHAAPTSTA